ncbi:MAG: hypothetical protein M1833_000444 [Piccolia ochrophora]|nr:MAG: hypothetical protein M1833_000444 [Piccolia ochrophora]
MEIDEASTANADIDILVHDLSSRGAHGKNSSGKSSRVVSRYSPTNKRKGSDDEDTPLLARHHSDSSAVTASSLGDHEGGRAGNGWSGDHDFDGLTWWNKPSIYWLLPPFFLFTLAFGGIVVPKLNLILSLICRDFLAERAMKDPSTNYTPVIPGSEDSQCQIPEVQALVARFTLWVNLVTGILSAITTPFLGSLSDRYGRKYLIAGTTLGILLSEVITILAATFPDVISVYWLFLGYAFDGLFGSFTAGMALTHSYATDCTHPARRNVIFGYFHGCLFTGIALGPVIAGYIVEACGDIVVLFYIVLVCHFIFASFMVFVAPESLTKERQMKARAKHELEKSDGEDWAHYTSALSSWSHAKVVATGLFTNVMSPLRVFYPTGDGASRAVRMNLLTLAAVDSTMFAVAMGSMTVVIIYSEFMFGWGNLQTSQFVSIVNSGRVFMLIVVLPLITRLARGSPGKSPSRNSGSDMLDILIIRAAILFDMLGYLGYTLARTGPLFIVSGLVGSFGGMGSPTIQSAMTKHVPQDRTGELLGSMGLLHALGRVVAPTIFNYIYSLTVGKYNQAVFVCLTASFGVSFILSWFIKPHGMTSPTPKSTNEEPNSKLTNAVYLDEHAQGESRKRTGSSALEPALFEPS